MMYVCFQQSESSQMSLGDSELIQKLQSEIVLLENKLCEKEDEIEQLKGEREGVKADVVHILDVLFIFLITYRDSPWETFI